MIVLVALQGRERVPRALSEVELFGGVSVSEIGSMVPRDAREWWVVDADNSAVAVQVAKDWPRVSPGNPVLAHFKDGQTYLTRRS